MMKMMMSMGVLGFMATAASASMIDCSGQEQVAGRTDVYTVAIDRFAFDQLPGTPVQVTVKAAYGKERAKEILTRVSGRMQGFPDAGGISVEFNGGTLKAEPGNSGITGISPALAGKLQLTGHPRAITVRCPLKKSR